MKLGKSLEKFMRNVCFFLAHLKNYFQMIFLLTDSYFAHYIAPQRLWVYI